MVVKLIKSSFLLRDLRLHLNRHRTFYLVLLKSVNPYLTLDTALLIPFLFMVLLLMNSLVVTLTDSLKTKSMTSVNLLD